jgi:hypothetical protein
MYTAASIWLQVYHQNPQSDILYILPPSPHHTPIFAELPFRVDNITVCKVWLV